MLLDRNRLELLGALRCSRSELLPSAPARTRIWDLMRTTNKCMKSGKQKNVYKVVDSEHLSVLQSVF